MTSDNEKARRKSLNAALLQVKRLAFETHKPHYIVKHGRWRYRVTTRLPNRRTDLVFWSNSGE